jgi:hypothetical protein
MNLPKFLIGDNTDTPDAIYVIHTEFPRFIINLVDDSIEWFEEFSNEDLKELEEEMTGCVDQASEFYDREMARYENSDD